MKTSIEKQLNIPKNAADAFVSNEGYMGFSDENYHNFSLFGIGTPSAGQLARREKRAAKQDAKTAQYRSQADIARAEATSYIDSLKISDPNLPGATPPFVAPPSTDNAMVDAPEKQGMSTTAIIGLVAGGLLIIGTAAYFLFLRKK